MLCARGVAGVQQLYDPDRLKKPMIQRGARGSDNWQEVSWKEALDFAADGLRKIAEKYNRNGLVISGGADMQTSFAKRFGTVFGTRNVTTQESL